MVKYYEEEELVEEEQQPQIIGCGYCWDTKKNKSKELFFLDRANNMRPCLFCPNCGRAYEE